MTTLWSRPGLGSDTDEPDTAAARHTATSTANRIATVRARRSSSGQLPDSGNRLRAVSVRRHVPRAVLAVSRPVTRFYRLGRTGNLDPLPSGVSRRVALYIERYSSLPSHEQFVRLFLGRLLI